MSAPTPDWLPRLEAFLSDRAGAPARVTALRHLTGGASRDTWAIDVEAGGERLALVLRRDLGGTFSDEALPRGQEFAVLGHAVVGGVLAPRPRWLCEDAAVLGVPFFLMDRLEGESVGSRVVRRPDLGAARAALPAQMAEQLALIHALPLTDDLAFLPRPLPGLSPAQTALERAAAQLTSLGEPHPVLELAIRWLRRHAPPCPEPVFLHGDLRVGNLMVGPAGLVGVFDWELAHVGDPHEDLAWPVVRAWRFGQDKLRLGGVGDVEPYLAEYERRSGRAVDRAALTFWEIAGALRWGVGCVAQAHRHLSGQVESLELASLGRRAAEMELEVLDLIERAER
jgi:aminoglycoside phosphotransferase (APT) family kinase protein